MKPTKRIAGVAAAALAIAGLAAVAAPSAQAYGPTSSSLPCRIYFADTGTGTSPSTYTDTFTLTQSPANPDPGQTVTVTMSAVTGTINGPVPLSANVLTVVADIQLGGTLSSNVQLLSGASNNYPATATGAGAALGPWTATGTYVVPSSGSSGAASLALRQLRFDDGRGGGGTGSNVDTYCSGGGGDADHKASPTTATAAGIYQAFNVTGPSFIVSSVTGQRAGVTAAARAGDTINVTSAPSGNFWSATPTPTAQLCDSAGNNCESAGGSLSVTGTTLSGTVVPSAANTARAGVVKITQGSTVTQQTMQILGNRSITLAPAAGPVGSSVVVTGSGWDANAALSGGGQIVNPGFGAPFIPGTNAQVTPTTSGSGTFSTTVVISDAGTVNVSFAETPPFGAPATDNASASWSFARSSCTVGVDIPCGTDQILTAVVNPGTLSQAAQDPPATGPGSQNANKTSINMGNVTSAPSAQTMNGRTNVIRVIDARGGLLGWSLTASVANDFSRTGGGSTIAKSGLALANGTCTGTASSAAPVAATGIAGGFAGSSTVTVCQVAAGGAGGQYDVVSDVTLNVPAFQQAGTYSTTMVFTLA